MNNMKIKNGIKLGAFWGMLFLSSCHSGYSIIGVEGGREPITSEYDTNPDRQALALVERYKNSIDSIMSPVVGHAANDLKSYRPESPLSNLIADILRNSVFEVTGKRADIAVMNMGGIRSSISKGEITYGNIFEIAPFENALCILTMDGKTVMELFEQIASVYGEGLSGASLEISDDGKLVSAKINGKDIDPNKEYIVATIDYLAEGNDKMLAFKKAKSKTLPKNCVLRELLLKYVTECNKKGKFVDASVEGRIKIR